jgi:hypothetical protein
MTYEASLTLQLPTHEGSQHTGGVGCRFDVAYLVVSVVTFHRVWVRPKDEFNLAAGDPPILVSTGAATWGRVTNRVLIDGRLVGVRGCRAAMSTGRRRSFARCSAGAVLTQRVVMRLFTCKIQKVI